MILQLVAEGAVHQLASRCRETSQAHKTQESAILDDDDDVVVNKRAAAAAAGRDAPRAMSCGGATVLLILMDAVLDIIASIRQKDNRRDCVLSPWISSNPGKEQRARAMLSTD